MKEMAQFLILLCIWKWKMSFKQSLIIKFIDVFF